jgi:hypothetical protein
VLRKDEPLRTLHWLTLGWLCRSLRAIGPFERRFEPVSAPPCWRSAAQGTRRAAAAQGVRAWLSAAVGRWTAIAARSLAGSRVPPPRWPMLRRFPTQLPLTTRAAMGRCCRRRAKLSTQAPIPGGSEAGGLSPPPSCAPGGPGMTHCGANRESGCASLEVTGGTYGRTYEMIVANDGAFSSNHTFAADGGPTGEADRATVSRSTGVATPALDLREELRDFCRHRVLPLARHGVVLRVKRPVALMSVL